MVNLTDIISKYEAKHSCSLSELKTEIEGTSILRDGFLRVIESDSRRLTYILENILPDYTREKIDILMNSGSL